MNYKKIWEIGIVIFCIALALTALNLVAIEITTHFKVDMGYGVVTINLFLAILYTLSIEMKK